MQDTARIERIELLGRSDSIPAYGTGIDWRGSTAEPFQLNNFLNARLMGIGEDDE